MKLNLKVRILALTLCLLLGALPVAAVERPFAFHGNGQVTFITDWAGNIMGADFTVAGRKLGAGMDATAESRKLGAGMDATAADGAIQPGLWRGVGALQFTPATNNGRRIGEEIPTFQGRVRMGEEIPTLQFTSVPSHPNFLLTSGATTITAANGDKLQALIDGVMDVTTGLARGRFQFVGGTGQFTQASGSAHFVVEQNRDTGTFELTAVGSINF